MEKNEQFSGQNNTEQIMAGQNISEQRSSLKAGKTIPQIISGSAVWTCILAYVLILAGQLIGELAVLASGALKSDLGTTAGLYFSFAGIWLVLFLNALIKKNRPLFKAYGTGCKGNNAVNLLIGYLIGIGMNGAAILMAWMHGDIRMYFDKFELVPFIILFIAVFVQSAAEEMICRGFIYQRVLHGISAMAVVDLVVTGLLFSAMVYYFDSLWMAMAAHAGWNFTQSILAGLPNSGNVVPYSVFKLDAAAARDSFFYNVAFGVEGTVPAIAIQAVVLVALVAVGIKLGGKPADIWAGEET